MPLHPDDDNPVKDMVGIVGWFMALAICVAIAIENGFFAGLLAMIFLGHIVPRVMMACIPAKKEKSND